MDEEEFRQIIEDYRLDCQFPQRLFRNEERCEKASWSKRVYGIRMCTNR